MTFPKFEVSLKEVSVKIQTPLASSEQQFFRVNAKTNFYTLPRCRVDFFFFFRKGEKDDSVNHHKTLILVLKTSPNA